MNYIPLASAPSPLSPLSPLCSQCDQGGILENVQSPCGCTLPIHKNCIQIAFLRGMCPFCKKVWIQMSPPSSVSSTIITYAPDRRWILYGIYSLLLIIFVCVIMWLIYRFV